MLPTAGAVARFFWSLAKPVLVALLVLIPLIALTSIWWDSQTEANRLSHVPPGFRVTNVIETGQVLAGIGPGGNETGLILYELPTDVAASIERGGIEQLALLSAPPSRHDFTTWYPTPFAFSDSWTRELSADWDNAKRPSITDFMRRHWPEVNVTPELETMVTRFLHEPGNFYAYDGARMLIVAPASRSVAFAYSG